MKQNENEEKKRRSMNEGKKRSKSLNKPLYLFSLPPAALKWSTMARISNAKLLTRALVQF